MDRTSRSVVERARTVIPGGAQTGLRAQAYDYGPIAFDGASGATLETVEGERYTDYHLAFGPIVLGHGRSEVDAAVKSAIETGCSTARRPRPSRSPSASWSWCRASSG